MSDNCHSHVLMTHRAKAIGSVYYVVPGLNKPVQCAHVDYTVNSRPIRLRDLLPQEAEALQKKAYAVIQASAMQTCHAW